LTVWVGTAELAVVDGEVWPSTSCAAIEKKIPAVKKNILNI
jgi:hypothetical protein